MSNPIQQAFPLSNTLGRLTYQATRAISLALGRRLHEAGFPVSVEQWRVLAVLSHLDGMTQQELSQRLGQDKTGISRLACALEGKGLIARRTGSSDRRLKRLYLTQAGRRLFEASLPLALEVNEIAVSGLSAEELHMLRRALDRIIGNLEPPCCGG